MVLLVALALHEHRLLPGSELVGVRLRMLFVGVRGRLRLFQDYFESLSEGRLRGVGHLLRRVCSFAADSLVVLSVPFFPVVTIFKPFSFCPFSLDPLFLFCGCFTLVLPEVVMLVDSVDDVQQFSGHFLVVTSPWPHLLGRRRGGFFFAAVGGGTVLLVVCVLLAEYYGVCVIVGGASVPLPGAGRSVAGWPFRVFMTDVVIVVVGALKGGELVLKGCYFLLQKSDLFPFSSSVFLHSILNKI